MTAEPEPPHDVATALAPVVDKLTKDGCTVTVDEQGTDRAHITVATDTRSCQVRLIPHPTADAPTPLIWAIGTVTGDDTTAFTSVASEIDGCTITEPAAQIAWAILDHLRRPTLDEHLAWCRERALAELDANNPDATINALSSMISDLGKHPGGARHPALPNLMMLSATGIHEEPEQVRSLIEQVR